MRQRSPAFETTLFAFLLLLIHSVSANIITYDTTICTFPGDPDLLSDAITTDESNIEVVSGITLVSVGNYDPDDDYDYDLQILEGSSISVLGNFNIVDTARVLVSGENSSLTSISLIQINGELIIDDNALLQSPKALLNNGTLTISGGADADLETLALIGEDCSTLLVGTGSTLTIDTFELNAGAEIDITIEEGASVWIKDDTWADSWGDTAISITIDNQTYTDLDSFLEDYNPAMPIPEPASLLLIAATGVTMLGIKRRFSRN